jgi:hypothetical protein
MKVKIVTSFNEELWTKYAKNSLDSWVDFINLDEGSIIECWILGAFPRGLPTKTKSGIPFVYKMVETQSQAWANFYTQYKDHPKPKMPPNAEYKFNFVPFSIKAFALAEAAFSIREKEPREFDYMCWIDADVVLRNFVTSTYLKEVIGNNHLAWLDRGAGWGHGETGFILANTSGDTLDIFLQQANLYGAGQLFYFAEWHDAFVFTSLVRLKSYMEGPETFSVKNLNTDMESKHNNGLRPFETSILNTHMTHYKGQTKDQIPSA